MFADKRLRAGDGIAVRGENGRAMSKDLGVLYSATGETAEQFRAIEHLYDESSNTFAIPSGMIMGMANVLSTFGAYIVTSAEAKLQSSDDFCCVYNPLDLDSSLQRKVTSIVKALHNIAVEKLGSMITSRDKSYLLKGKNEIEMNSLVVQNTPVMVAGVEVPSLTPLGKSPIIDINTCMQNISEIVARLLRGHSRESYLYYTHMYAETF